MYGFIECSSCGALYNREHCCSNVSSVDNFVRDPNSPSQPQTSSFNQRRCFHCKDLLEEDEHCKRCTCKRCGYGLSKGFCFICASSIENSSIDNPNPNSFNDPPNVFSQPPQHQYETYSCEFYGGNSHPGFDCQKGNTPVFDQGPCYNQDFGFNQPSHYSPSQPQTYSYELCGNDAHYGYDCSPQVPFISNPDPCYNQDLYNFLQTSLNFQQQYLCCENCGGPHETFQCQPLNQNFCEPNLCYKSIASGFDQLQPPQFPVIHQPPQEMSIQDMEDLKQQYLDKMKKKLQQLEQVANLSTYPSRFFNSFCYDDDDDEEYTIAITPVLPTEEADNSLSMGDEQLSTIPETESDELIKSSVENLVPIPSEFEDECECDVPDCDDS
ncbi:hypothetical protein Tco_0098119 [Tanacetum coccineum]